VTLELVCRRRNENPRSSEDRVGDDNAGDSSASETWPLSSEAAKLLEISGSETKAYDDCVEAVDVVKSFVLVLKFEKFVAQVAKQN